MPERVVVAMSGGVDSSVALLKVLEAGYNSQVAFIAECQRLGYFTKQNNRC